MTTKYMLDGVEFKVGDKVKIVKAFGSASSEGHMGSAGRWTNCWTTEMASHVGRVVTISKIGPCGVYFTEVSLGWPLSVLENITTKERKAAADQKARHEVEKAEAAKRAAPVKFRPFMRVKLRNGENYIIVPKGETPSTTPLCFVSSDGWLAALMKQGDSDFYRKWDVVEIYAAPRRATDMLYHGRYGAMLWSEVSAKQAAETEAKKARIAVLKAELEALEMEVA